LLEKGQKSLDSLDFSGAVIASQEVISINPDDARGYAVWHMLIYLNETLICH
jgi:hypothetical protein